MPSTSSRTKPVSAEPSDEPTMLARYTYETRRPVLPSAGTAQWVTSGRTAPYMPPAAPAITMAVIGGPCSPIHAAKGVCRYAVAPAPAVTIAAALASVPTLCAESVLQAWRAMAEPVAMPRR